MAEIVTTVVGAFRDEVTPALSEVQKKIEGMFGGFVNKTSSTAKESAENFKKEFATASEVETKAKRDQAIATNEAVKALQNELKTNQDYIKSKVEATKATQQLGVATQQAIKNDQEAVKTRGELMKSMVGVRTEVMKNLAQDKDYVKQRVETMKVTQQLQASVKAEIASDKELAKAKAETINQSASYNKSLKEMAQEGKNAERVTKSLADAEKILAEVEKNVATGAMTLKDAEAELTKNAKALTTEIMALEKGIAESGKATKEETARLKELYGALDTMKEAADEAGDAQNKFNRLMQNSDERLANTLKSTGMLAGAMTGLAGTIGSVFGEGTQKMVDFAGSAANAATGFADMIDTMKAGKDMGGLQGAMTQAASYIGMVQMGLQLVMQVFTMIDGAMKKHEEEVIKQGKSATEISSMFKSYELGNKTMQDRIGLIDKVAEKDQALASSLRGVASDSEKFSQVLVKVNEKLKATREAGMGMEWKVGETGGGLIGWFKSAGTEIEKMAVVMGKARVAIDELRQNVTQTGADLQTATQAGVSYSADVQTRILQMDIQILQKKGMILEARNKEIDILDREKEKVIELIKQKQIEIKLREADAKIQSSTIMKAKSDMDDIIRKMDHTTGAVSNYAKKMMNITSWTGEDGENAWKKWKSGMQEILEQAVDTAIASGDATLKGVSEILTKVYGNFKSGVMRDGKEIMTGVGELLIGENNFSDSDLQRYVKSLLEIKPAMHEVSEATKLYATAQVQLQTQLDGVAASFEQLKNKQWELWKVEDEAGKKDPAKKPEVKPKKEEADEVVKNLQNILNGYAAFDKALGQMSFKQMDELTYSLSKRLKELQGLEAKYGLDPSIITEREALVGLLNDTSNAYKKLQEQIEAIGSGVTKSIESARQKLADLQGPPVDEVTKRIRESDRQIDAMINIEEEKLREQYRLGNITNEQLNEKIALLEGQRTEWKNIQNEIIVTEANAGKLDETTKDWASATNQGAQGMSEANKQTAELQKKLAELDSQIAKNVETIGKFKLDIDLDQFNADLDRAMFGDKRSVAEKLKDGVAESLGQLKSTTEETVKDINKKYDELEKGLKKNSDEYAKYEKLRQQEITMAWNTESQKRLEIVKKNALDVAAAYKTEYDKLMKMEDDYQKRLQDREKMVADARSEVAKYVTRAKLTEIQKQAYDQADQLGAEYERLRKAGLSENELTEWLAIKKNEILKGANKDGISEFEKYWAQRKKMADDVANTEKEAWDNETNRQKQAINDQIDLVNQLKNLAIEAKKTLLDMLGLPEEVKKIMDGLGGSGSGSQGGGTKDMYGPSGIKPQDGTLYSSVKGKLSPEYEPSSEMKARIGTYGIIDLQFVDYTKKGGSGWGWIAYRGASSSGQGSQPQPGSGQAGETTPPDKSKEDFVPVETSKEIKQRIADYKELHSLAKQVEGEMKDQIETFKQAVRSLVEDNVLNPTKDPAKKYVESWGEMGNEAVKRIRKPLEAYIKDRLLGWEIAEWGTTLIQNFAIGMDSGGDMIKSTILDIIAEKIGKYIKSHSPPEAGPLKDIVNWGKNLSGCLAEGLIVGAVYIEDAVQKVSTTISKGIGNLSGNIVSGFQTGFEEVKEMFQTYGQTYQDEVNGWPTFGDSTKGDFFQSFKTKLLSNSQVNDAYNTRQTMYGQTETDYEAFYKSLAVASNKSDMDRIAGFFNGDMTKKADSEIYNWFMTNFDKQIIPPDLGEVGFAHVEQEVKTYPWLKDWFPYQRKLKEQYPELLQELFNKGVLTPVNASRIAEDEKGNRWVVEGENSPEIAQKYGTKGTKEYDPSTMKTIGWYQKGTPFDQRSVDSMMDNINGKDTFSDWMQKKFNSDVLQGGGGSLDGWIEARDQFLGGFSQSRIRELVTEYQKYINDGTKLQTSGEAINDILSKYGQSEVATLMKTGMSLEEALSKNSYAGLLGSDFIGKDKTVLSGGGFFDKNGKEVISSELWKNMGNGETGQAAWAELMKGVGMTDPAITKFREGVTKALGGHSWGWAWFWGRGKNGTPVELPYTVMETGEADELRRAGYDISAMSYEEMLKMYGEEAVKQMLARGLWGYVLLSADRAGSGEAGNFSDIEADVNKQMEVMRAERAKLIQAISNRGGEGPQEGDIFAGLTYKNKYTTVKGDYLGGVSQLGEFFGGMDETKKADVLSGLMDRIDQYYKDESTTIPGYSEVSGGVANPGGTVNTKKELVRRAMKAYLADQLGFSNEFSVARGWKLADDSTDANKLAFEEILKNVDLLNNELIKVAGTPDDVTGAGLMDINGVAEVNSKSSQQTVIDYIKNILKDGSNYDTQNYNGEDVYTLKSEVLNQIKAGLQEAYQSGNATESDVNDIIKMLLPSNVSIPKEIVGLPGYNPESGLMSSPWGFEGGMYGPGTWNTIGQRYFIGGPGGATISQGKGFGMPVLGAGMSNLGQQNRFDPYQYQPWLGYAGAMAPLSPLGMAYRPPSDTTPNYTNTSGSGTTYMYINFNNTRIEGVANLEDALLNLAKKCGWQVRS